MATYTDIPASSGTGLTPIADQTVLGNVSGSSATPTALTAAQVLTLLGVTPYSSSAQAALIRAQALLGSQFTSIGGTDFYSSGDFVSTGSSGSGGAVLSTADRAGVVLVSTGTTTLSSGRCRLAGLGTQVANCKTDKFYAVARMALGTTVDGATIAHFRLVANSTNSFFELGVQGGTSSTNFSVVVRDAGTTIRTNTATSVAVDLLYHTMEIWSDATNLNFAIDGTTVNQTATSLLSAGEACMLDFNLANNGTAANRQINCDSMWIVTQPN
jgi:hypothetical protein